MWVATVDFMKAVDSISHKSLWKVLEKMWNRTTIRQPREEAPRGRESDRLNGQEREVTCSKKREERSRATHSSVLLFTARLQR